MKMSRILCVSILALASTIALAAVRPMTITLTPPTTYTDNSTIAPGDITGYSIACSFTPTGGTATGCQLASATIPGNVTSAPNSITYADVGGQMCLSLATVTALYGASDQSSQSCRTLPAVSNPSKRPRPVQGLTIVIGS